MELLIYYDNPNEPSDTYLKWLKKDCETNGIDVTIVDNVLKLEWKLANNPNISVLPMFPVKDSRVKYVLSKYPVADIDGVYNNSVYEDATAMGIYNHILETHPDRKTSVSVIGRGKVGSTLAKKLMEYGYTIHVFNSKSSIEDMDLICQVASDVVVGVASAEIYDEEMCDLITSRGVELIDSGFNFKTKNKLRCGKWTRNIIIQRIKSVPIMLDK